MEIGITTRCLWKTQSSELRQSPPLLDYSSNTGLVWHGNKETLTIRPQMPGSTMCPETLTPTRKFLAEAGFTLLELMVAMVLTSLLTLTIYTSLSLCLKTMRRGQAAAEVLQELRVGQRILTRSLSSTLSGSIGTRLYFLGDSEQMRLFTTVPLEAHSLGGIYHWRVLVGKDKASHVALAVEQTKNVNWHRDPEGVETRQVIMSNMSSAHFSYGRGQKSQEFWDAKTEGSLPDWVMVHLTIKGKQPIVLLIPIHVAETENDQSPR
jgi:prepilin-type N-terminal cleavage/methylation domain-containing protein